MNIRGPRTDTRFGRLINGSPNRFDISTGPWTMAISKKKHTWNLFKAKLICSWWFQPIQKIWIKLDHFPKWRWKLKGYWKRPPNSSDQKSCLKKVLNPHHCPFKATWSPSFLGIVWRGDLKASFLCLNAKNMLAKELKSVLTVFS